MPFIPSLDHIIILVPHATLNSPPKSLTSSFTIYPGGTHADQKTLNTLILLKSGVYLELISFVNDAPEKREGHWWGTKQPGTIIDWALTSKSTSDIDVVRTELGKLEGKGSLGEVGYQESKKGGRKRLDGESVEWEVTFPSPSIERGVVPFWCHDITSRELRVPVKTAESSTNHSSGAIGVSKVVLVVSPENFLELAEVYAKILGSEGVEREGEVSFTITQPIPGSSTSSIILRKAQTQEEKAIVEANGGIAGIWEIILAVTGTAPAAIEEKIGNGVIRIGFDKFEE
jgi:hypothetical protein